MERHQVELDAPGLDRAGTVIRYGHSGRPVIVFPSERGRAWDYESNGMVGAVAHLIDEGRVKLYCVDSFDDADLVRPRAAARGARPAARRLRELDHWTRWSPFVGSDSPGAADAVVTGCSMGAYHALQLALTRADLFPVAICQSRQLRPVDLARLGRARRGGVLHQPGRLRRRTCTATTSTGCARGCTSC